MKLATKLLTATFVIGAIGAAALERPAAAAPITAPAGLQNTPPAIQTVQWRDWNSGATQYGPGGTQLGSDYQYYGPRSGNYRSSPGYYEGESGPASGTQYGPDYGYYGPRSGSGSAYDSYAYSGSGGMSTGRDPAYCQQRFRSFDPASGTYVGFDGRRHPCP
jgi:hypothetical protein